MRLRYLIIALLFCTVSARAQLATGTIEGTVTDATGAVTPGTQVVITNTGTGLVRTLTTDSTGIYRATMLPPGNYKVDVSLTGFQPQSKVGLVLSVDQTLTVNFELQPGEQKETVTVVARSEQLVQTATSNLGQVIDQAPLRDLPLNGRNFQQLIALNTGTQLGAQGDDTGNKYHINGGRGEGNLFLVDGVDISSNFSNTTRINPTLESIAEFKIITNNFSAEYGRAVGGVINVQLKSGTNKYHGTVFEFVRNDVMDAANYFINLTGLEKPPYRMNQFGGSLGGPIKKDTAFFFMDYEGSRARYTGQAGYAANVPTASTSGPGLFSVPTAAMRTGDFSALLPGTVIYDPATFPATAAFANNIIPPDRIDVPALKMLSYLPLPNRSGTFNFVTNMPAMFTRDSADVRVDYRFNERNNLSASFSINQVDGRSSPPLGKANGFLITADYPHNYTRRISLNYTRLLGSRAVNELIVGYARDRWEGPCTDGHEYMPDLGIRYLNTNPNDCSTTGMPLVIDVGATSLTFGGPLGPPFKFVTNIPQITDNFSWSRGRHLLKTGFAYRARQFNPVINVYPRGLYVFLFLTTSNLFAPSLGGDGFASFLLGYPYSATKDLTSGYGQRLKEYSGYLQDDFKVTNRLTLNLGVRWDLFMPAKEQYNRQSNFDMATKTVIIAGQNGVSDTANVATNKRNFGPHVGFAYALTADQKTVLRGGFGIAYQPLATSSVGISGRLTQNPPFRLIYANTFGFILPTVRLSDGLEMVSFDPLHPTGSLTYIPPEQPFPYLAGWNLNLQRALTPNLMLDVAYSGSRGAHLTGDVNINQAPPGPGDIAARSLILPSLNSIISLANRESSFYHSLQVKLERRLANGFYLLGAYTLAKSIDEGSYTDQGSGASSVQPQNALNWRAERGLSDFDVRHRLVASYIYELPYGKGKRWGASAHPWVLAFLGGWQTNGILTLQSGTPFTPTMSSSATANAGPGGPLRPNCVAGASLYPAQQTIYNWYNKSAFTAPAQYTFGNCGRNILTGPAYRNLDFSMFKEFKLRESLTLRFRSEFFNFTNTPNFFLPVASVDSAAAGQITAARSPRQIQFALQLLF
jgi:hypothetical protein